LRTSSLRIFLLLPDTMVWWYGGTFFSFVSYHGRYRGKSRFIEVWAWYDDSLASVLLWWTEVKGSAMWLREISLMVTDQTPQ
jgi:hypothetical protein